MLVESSLAEMLLNAIGQDRIWRVQFSRKHGSDPGDERRTFEDLNKVIERRIEGACTVARERGFNEYNDKRWALEKERDSALDRIDTLNRRHEEDEAYRVKADEERDAALARVGELIEALRPFADAALAMSNGGTGCIGGSDYARARRAIRAATGSAGGETSAAASSRSATTSPSEQTDPPPSPPPPSRP